MTLISYIDFLLEGKRADAINLLTTKYNGNKEQAVQDITSIENQMMQMYNNKGLVNKYIFSVMNFIESSDNTGHAHEDSIKNVLSDLKRLIDWEPRMKQQNKQLTVDQLDNMSWIQFNKYLNDFYDAQPHDKWKTKYKKVINVGNISSDCDYEIVHVPNWNISKRYRGDKLTWCVTESNNALLQYTKNGELFVFAFRNGYDSLNDYEKDEKYLVPNGQHSSTDEFATSALAIRVHPDGKFTVTCRYNHEHGCNDDVYEGETDDILKRLNLYDSLLEFVHVAKEAHEAKIRKLKECISSSNPTPEMLEFMENYEGGLDYDDTLTLVNNVNMPNDIIIHLRDRYYLDNDAVYEYIFIKRGARDAFDRTGERMMGFISKKRVEIAKNFSDDEITDLGLNNLYTRTIIYRLIEDKEYLLAERIINLLYSNNNNDRYTALTYLILYSRDMNFYKKYIMNDQQAKIAFLRIHRVKSKETPIVSDVILDVLSVEPVDEKYKIIQTYLAVFKKDYMVEIKNLSLAFTTDVFMKILDIYVNECNGLLTNDVKEAIVNDFEFGKSDERKKMLYDKITNIQRD